MSLPTHFPDNARPRAFTLIEMLITVGILAILSTIAIPNYLASKTRANVSRVKADLNTIALGLEAYAADYNRYPSSSLPNPEYPQNLSICSQTTQCTGSHGTIDLCRSLTTPVAYLPNIKLPDPFFTGRPISHRKIYSRCYFYARSHNGNAIGPAYAVYSGGPSRNTPRPPNGGRYDYHHLLDMHDRSWFEALQYDITNGTYSRGIIMRYQK